MNVVVDSWGETVMDKMSNFFAVLAGCEDGVDLLDRESSISTNKEKRKEGGAGGISREVRNDGRKWNAVNDGDRAHPNMRMPLVWIDLEMTGLNVDQDKILEIACIITDGKLEKLIEGPDLILNQPEEALSGMNDWCQRQHTASGKAVGRTKSSVYETH